MGQMEIDSRTRLVGILGDPVAQSLSPAMHNAAFAALGMNWRYLAFHVSAGALPAALRGASALGLVGLNITVPHKVTAVGLVDELDALAQQVGAINTVRVGEGRLQGFNTDVNGVLDALTIEGQASLAGSACVLIGAGGGGRAAAVGLVGAGASRLTILNRTVSRARGLAQVIARIAPRCHVDADELLPATLARSLQAASVLVHASRETMSAAMGGGGGRADWVRDVGRALRPGMTVLDMVYTPVWTELLTAARAAGAVAVSGVVMLVHQGARSFELWTGRSAPRDTMRRAVGLVEASAPMSERKSE